jgi:TPR repeat protein
LLGTLYKDGLGVTQEFNNAMYWYRKAAEQGDVTAQGNLKFMHAKGLAST